LAAHVAVANSFSTRALLTSPVPAESAPEVEPEVAAPGPLRPPAPGRAAA